jgi:hypothetical protein
VSFPSVATIYVQYTSPEGIRFVARVNRGACAHLFREGVERHKFGTPTPKIETDKLSSSEARGASA